MKSVLISIQPKWCHRIIDGEKKIEVRKTKPKLATPFKVYIYCSAGSYDWRKDIWATAYFPTSGECTNMSQMVIGEFVCDKIITVDCDSVAPFDPETHEYIQAETCLDRAAFIQYTNFKKAFGWHISNLKIYDKPKALSEFISPTKAKNCVDYCLNGICSNLGYEELCGAIRRCEYKKLSRPPQSWCYVESQ